MSAAPPKQPQAKVYLRGKLPFCGGCNRRVQQDDQWRCPYVGCQAWLRGTDARV